MSGMLDWSQIAGFQEASTSAVSGGVAWVQLPMKLQLTMNQLMTSFGIDEKNFNLGRDVTVIDDPTWVERMVDRFTGYLDGKILELQEWVTQGLHNFGQGCTMFIIAGGELFCIVYGISIVFRMMLNTKKDEDYITKGMLAAGGFLVLRSLEAAVFGV